MSPVLACYLWKTARWTQGSRLVFFTCFAPLCWQKTDATLPQLAIYIGPCLQSSAEEPQHVGISRPRTGFVNDEAGCCCMQLGAAWVGGGEEKGLESVTPSLGATLALPVGQDRMRWYPIPLPVANPHPNNIAHSLVGVWEPGSYIYFLCLHFEAAKVCQSFFCYPTLANLGISTDTFCISTGVRKIKKVHSNDGIS